MIVAATPGLARRPSAAHDCAIVAISWSPSITLPFSSTITTRSASPSSAMPMSAFASSTLATSAAVAVEPTSRLMLKPSGLVPMLDHLGAQFPERQRRDAVGGAVGGIDHDAQALERHVARQRALGEFDVAFGRAVDALGAAELVRRGEAVVEVGVDQRLDLALHRSESLKPVRSEQLDAVVGVLVVRGGDHDAEIAAHRARQHGDARRRDRAGEEHVHADRQEARGQRVLDHVARKPRVLADDDAVAVVAALEHQPRGLAGFQRQFGVIGNEFAWPRMPSVPKYLRALAKICRLLPARKVAPF